MDAESRDVRTEDVSSGMGSSGLVLWVRRGRNGLKGSGCSRRAEVRIGASRIAQSAMGLLSGHVKHTIDQIPSQYQHILYNIYPLGC